MRHEACSQRRGAQRKFPVSRASARYSTTTFAFGRRLSRGNDQRRTGSPLLHSRALEILGELYILIQASRQLLHVIFGGVLQTVVVIVALECLHVGFSPLTFDSKL